MGELYGGRVGELAGMVEIPPGEQHKTIDTAGASGARWPSRASRARITSSPSAAASSATWRGSARRPTSEASRSCRLRRLSSPRSTRPTAARPGVDLPAAKNYVGAYHQPAAVIADTSTLATLPPEEHAAGYAEVVKTALIAGGALWDRVASGEPVDEDVILACARTKLAIVGRGRARRGPPAGAQPRPHGRPRDRDGHRLLALPPRRGRRRWACSPRCG